MQTKLKYLENTYLFEDTGNILDIEEDENGQYCILDSTIFYPQGGGQATDIGKICINNASIGIHFVAFINGVVRHYGEFNDINIIGEEAILYVDKITRMLNAKSHTAGHLVSSVIESMDSLVGVKGYHFPNGSYIEFEGTKPEDIENFIIKANETLKREVQNNTNISTKIVTKEELYTLCKNVPEFLPTKKPIRIMTLQNFEPILCGGTHLSTLKDLDNVTITKIKSKKGRVKASYTFR